MSETITTDAAPEQDVGAPEGAAVEPRHEADTQEAAPAEAPEGEKRQEFGDKTPAWLRRKIDRATFEMREAQRQAQAARDEAENYRRALAAARGEQDQPRQLTEDQIRQQERARFEGEQATRSFNERCNAIAKSVSGTHGDEGLNQATAALVERADLDFGNRRHQSVIEDISELPNSGEVYYALAHDPDAASAILNAPERRQYAMLMEFAGKLGQAAPKGQQSSASQQASPAVSRAPAPVSAPSGAARSSSRSIYDPNLSPAEFDRLYKEQFSRR